MGFAEILTIIFVLLKVFKIITWSWWLVFLPEIIAFVLYIGIAIANGLIFHKAKKSMDKHREEFWK